MKGRRTRKGAAAKLRPFWILILLIIMGAATGAYYAARWPGFYVRAIIVRGNREVHTEDIVRAAAIDRRRNLWLQDPQRMVSGIESIPNINQAHVTRRLPANVTLVVDERKPYAAVLTATARGVVDRSLRVLDATVSPNLVRFLSNSPLSFRPGTFLRVPQLVAMQRDLDVLKDAHVPVATMRFAALGELTITLRSGVVVKIGDDGDLSQKAPLIAPIVAQTQRNGKKLRALDLRAPKTPVAEFR